MPRNIMSVETKTVLAKSLLASHGYLTRAKRCQILQQLQDYGFNDWNEEDIRRYSEKALTKASKGDRTAYKRRHWTSNGKVIFYHELVKQMWNQGRGKLPADKDLERIAKSLKTDFGHEFSKTDLRNYLINDAINPAPSTN